MTFQDPYQVTDVQVERARFTFAFDRGMAELLGPERMTALVGQHIDFRWNDQVADALVKDVALDPVTGTYSVTMEIEASMRPVPGPGDSGMTIYGPS